MSILEVKDRIPTQVLGNGAIRYGVYDENNNLLRYEYMKREDEPIEEGTPVNKVLFENIQGDLYTQDRYNILDIQRRVVPVDYVTDIIISQNVNVEDCIPKIWVADDDTNLRFTAEDGTKLYTTSTSTYNASTYANMACDGDVSTYWSAPSNSTNDGIILKFTKPIIITKMKTYIGLSSYYASSSYYIKGSNDGINWTTILTNTVQQSLTSIELPTKAPYQYYQFSVGATGSRKNVIYELQVEEYISDVVYGDYIYYGNLDIPLVSYEKNKKISIENNNRIIDEGAVIYNTYTTDIIPKTWAEVTKGTKYVAEDGTILEGTGANNYNTGYEVYLACDGDTNTYRMAGNQANVSLTLTLPEPKIITKMKTYLTSNQGTRYITARILGSENGTTWINLANISEGQNSLTEIALSNVGNYKYYRIAMTLSSANYYAWIYEWQVSEWKELSDEPVYIDSIDNPYLNINNLGERKINGTINYGEKYDLVYNGESWDISSKIVTGTFSTGSTSGQIIDIDLTFEPDIVFMVGTFNQIITKIYTSSLYGINSKGFWWKSSSSSDLNKTAYYVAVKF